MSLVQHAQYELEKAGLFDKDSDYEGMLGEAVLELVKTFAAQGHSGFSAQLTLSIFNRVARFQTLTPVTSDTAEWMNVTEYFNGKGVWQNRRNPAVFSNDGGKTWYDLDERLKSRSYKIKSFFSNILYSITDVFRKKSNGSTNAVLTVKEDRPETPTSGSDEVQPR